MVKRILAIIGVILLVSLYAVTLFFAITDNPETMSYFKASFFLTCAVPIMIYGYKAVLNYIKTNAENAKLKDEIEKNKNNK